MANKCFNIGLVTSGEEITLKAHAKFLRWKGEKIRITNKKGEMEICGKKEDVKGLILMSAKHYPDLYETIKYVE